MSAPALPPLHIGILVEARYRAQAQPQGLARTLTENGHRVSLIDPEAGLIDFADEAWTDALDLVVARGRSANLLARMSTAEAFGVPTLNRRQAIAAVHDRAHMAARLAAGRIPTPRTWVGSFGKLAAAIPESAFPLILKPVFADDGRDSQVVDTREALLGIAWDQPIVIGQSFLPSAGYDLKLFAIGERVWAVRKRSPLYGGRGGAEPVALPPTWRDLARRCGELFGLSLFGVDCIETANGLRVIAVKDFPDYPGGAEIDAHLAAYIVRHRQPRRAS